MILVHTLEPRAKSKWTRCWPLVYTFSGQHFNCVPMAVGICTWPFQLRLRDSWNDRSSNIRELCMGHLTMLQDPTVDFLASQCSCSVRAHRFWRPHFSLWLWSQQWQLPFSVVLMCSGWMHGTLSISIRYLESHATSLQWVSNFFSKE